MRRQKSLRIGVHHANWVVWGPVYRTHLMRGDDVRVVALALPPSQERAPHRDQPHRVPRDVAVDVVGLEVLHR